MNQKIRNDHKSKAIEELMSYRDLVFQIKNLTAQADEAERVMQELAGIDYSKVRVAGGDKSCALINNICEWADIIQKLENKKLELARKQIRIQETMESLKKLEKAILTLYYMDGMNIYKIANKMAYSEPQIKRIKSDAIRHYEEQYKKMKYDT